MATLDEYEALGRAIARGARVYEYNGKRLEYRSLSEMYAIRRQLAAELGIAQSDGVSVVRYDKGFRPSSSAASGQDHVE